MSQRHGLTPNALGGRLTCMSPVDVIRFVCSIRRRLRLVDETSDPFLFKKSVDASQQLHTIESWYWKSLKIMAFDRPF